MTVFRNAKSPSGVNKVCHQSVARRAEIESASRLLLQRDIHAYRDLSMILHTKHGKVANSAGI